MNRITRIILRNLFRIPGYYFKLCRYARHPKRYTREETWAYIHKVLKRVLATSNVELEVTGTEYLQPNQGFMLYGNHQGMFDVVAIAATCPYPLSIVYKKELQNIPLLKQILKCTNSYAMDREDVRQSLTVIQNVTRQVQEGHPYVIFPEGTRSKLSNEMLEFHGGSFRCALKAKCPIVPMALVDCYKAFDQKGSKPMKAQIHYLPTIPFEEYSHMKSGEVADLVKGRIAEAIAAHQ